MDTSEEITPLVETRSIPSSTVLKPPACTPESDRRLLARLLHMAELYRSEKALRQAVEIFFELAEHHDDTPEAAEARQQLLEIGDLYEKSGEFRQARGIYERLLG